MCIYKILAQNEDGYVILCNECNHYQLAFGTTGASFSKDKFVDFCDYVIVLNQSAVCNFYMNNKRIKINLFQGSVMMILNHKELKNLYEMVCEAKFNLEMDDLFTDLNVITE
jgi:hypothetical protein